jgi:hypothetical protein
MRQKYLTEAEVLKAIEDEPELPGPIDREILTVLKRACTSKYGKGSTTTIEELLRACVRSTKSGIIERIKKI